MITHSDLLAALDLEEIDTDLYRGKSLVMGLPRVYGGQVLAQTLVAAMRTVDDADGQGRKCHSLHSYFLRPGDIHRPIIYEVDRIRDGRSFCTRRVVAKQGGCAIFNASLSFQKLEDGVSHQIDAPDLGSPSDTPPDFDRAAEMAKLAGADLDTYRQHRLIFPPDILDIRSPHLERTVVPGRYEPRYGYWFRFRDVPDDPVIHRALLAFISDKALMMVGILPHNLNFNTHRIIGASLDHAMWFHDRIRVDDWIWYDIESPRAARARDLGFGRFYTQSGTLIASTAQEGLIRVVGKKDA